MVGSGERERWCEKKNGQGWLEKRAEVDRIGKGEIQAAVQGRKEKSEEKMQYKITNTRARKE